MIEAACAILALGAGVFVLTPLFKEPKGNLEVELLAETELDRLLNRKAIVYSNLKDLEFEYKLGRLSEGDFQRLEAGYKSEASQILLQLDAIGVEKNLDEVLERDVAARRARRNPPTGRDAGHEAARCPACGAQTPRGKRYCGDCGHRLP